MQAKTTLGKVFATWKTNNDGTDEQLMALLRATPMQFRELQGEVLSARTSTATGADANADSIPQLSNQAINSIANRRGVSAAGLSSIIKGL